MRIVALMIAFLALSTPSLAQPRQLTIAQPADATTMDPGRSTQVLTVNYFYNLYDTLTRWDAALKLQPDLKKRMAGRHEHGRAVRGCHQHRQTFRFGGDVRQEIARGCVRPMHIVKEED